MTLSLLVVMGMNHFLLMTSKLGFVIVSCETRKLLVCPTSSSRVAKMLILLLSCMSYE